MLGGLTGSAVPLASKKQLSARPHGQAKPASKPTAKAASAKAVPQRAKVHASAPAPAPLPAAVAPQTLRETALKLLALPADPARSGEAVIRFNHYRKSFPVWNGVVKFEDIDAQYSFSFVYRGDYKRTLRLDGGEVAETPGLAADPDYFLDVKPSFAYRIDIEEDPQAGIGAEGLRLREGPYSASNALETAPKQSRQVALLTSQLLSMDVKDLHTAEAKAIKEARDIEDVLYSSVSP